MAQGNGTAASLGLLVLRVGAGAMLFYGHGLPKLLHFAERAPRFFDPFGIGPARSLGLVVFAEVACSLLVVIGFATRFATIPPIVTMLVAAFAANAGQPFRERELALLYLAAFVTLLLTGPGRFAVDAKFGPRVTFKGGG